MKSLKSKMAVLSILLVNTVGFTFAFAENPKFITGIVNMFQAATLWITIIVGAGAGLFLGYHAIGKAFSDDQSVIAEKNRLMKNVFVGAVIAVSAGGIVTWVLSFF